MAQAQIGSHWILGCSAHHRVSPIPPQRSLLNQLPAISVVAFLIKDQLHPRTCLGLMQTTVLSYQGEKEDCH